MVVYRSWLRDNIQLWIWNMEKKMQFIRWPVGSKSKQVCSIQIVLLPRTSCQQLSGLWWYSSLGWAGFHFSCSEGATFARRALKINLEGSDSWLQSNPWYCWAFMPEPLSWAKAWQSMFGALALEGVSQSSCCHYFCFSSPHFRCPSRNNAWNDYRFTLLLR